ncbi:MAG: hypothetical protein IKQ46_10315 [Bacteroidales bacterium]|jgi:hypothetical protein|nr:hypothetical protein [Bacteroidales bacterium]
MKKIVVLILLTVLTINVFGQRRGSGAPNWISLAVKGGYGASSFLCSEALDINGFNQDYLGPTYCYGGRLGVVFIDKVGVSLEFMGSEYDNKYDFNNHEYNPLNIKDYDGSLKMKATDFLPLFRYTGEYGFYCELGPKFTKVKGVDMTNENPLVGDAPCEQYFKSSFTSVVFGFGFMPYNGDRVQVSLGIRAAYCPKNVLECDGSTNVYGYPEMTSNHLFNNIEMKPLSAQVLLEVNYHFARFGQATCGKQRIIFFK